MVREGLVLSRLEAIEVALDGPKKDDGRPQPDHDSQEKPVSRVWQKKTSVNERDRYERGNHQRDEHSCFHLPSKTPNTRNMTSAYIIYIYPI